MAQNKVKMSEYSDVSVFIQKKINFTLFVIIYEYHIQKMHHTTCVKQVLGIRYQPQPMYPAHPLLNASWL